MAEKRTMNLVIVSTTMLFTLILLVGRETTQAEELLGQQLRLSGEWIEDRFKPTRVRLWETKEAPQRGRVAGHIDTVNADTRTLRIGPIQIGAGSGSRIASSQLAFGCGKQKRLPSAAESPAILTPSTPTLAPCVSGRFRSERGVDRGSLQANSRSAVGNKRGSPARPSRRPY